jgi:hypothetical protein
MKRKDLLSALTTEGGLSSQTQRTYVYKDCPYVKVTVHFKLRSGEDPDDIIESLSSPCLALTMGD